MSRLPAVLGGVPRFPDGLPLARPDVGATDAIADELRDVLDSGVLTNGPTVRRLEEEAARYLGVRHVVAVASCTTGLMLVLRSFGPLGRVVLPSFTFAATAHAVHWAGGTVSFADVHPETLTLDPDDVEGRIGDAAALVPVHLYGAPCAVERLDRLADDVGIPVVYDAAHALGSRRAGRPVGRAGAAEVFSLSPTKVTVAGEGGLIATDDEALAEWCRLGRDYGNPGDYDCLFPGLNARMSELHAVVARRSLAGLDQRVRRRNVLAGRLHRRLGDVPGIGFPAIAEGDVSTIKDLTIIVDRDAFGLGAAELATALRHDGIDTRRYYHPPVHRQKAYAHLAPPAPLPTTDALSPRVLTLPLWSQMADRTIDEVGDAVAAIHAHAGHVRQVRS